MIKKSLLLAPLLAATAAASDFSYTQLDLGYLNGSAELPNSFTGGGFVDDDLDIEGLFIGGRYEITNNFFAYAKFEDGEIELDTIWGGTDIDTMRIEAGLGGHVSIASCADFYYSVGYKFTELDDGANPQRLGNIDVLVGIRWAPATWLEVNPYISHSFGVDDDDALDAVDVTTAGLNLYVTAYERVQPFAGVSVELDSSRDNFVSDLVLFSGGLRFSF
jgi:hypothetical protein